MSSITYGEGYRDPSPHVIDKGCMVKFFPSSYNGEYGFDSYDLRCMSDGDNNNFENTIGKHLTHEGKVSNRGTDPFVPDDNLLTSYQTTYKYMRVGWKPTGAIDSIYYVPRMTLMKGAEAKLKLVLEFKNQDSKPKKITLQFNKNNEKKYLSINNQQRLDINDPSSIVYITLTCHQEFENTIALHAMIDADTDKPDLCGTIHILPNAPSRQSAIQVAFVRVQTNIAGNDTKGIPSVGGEAMLRNILRQAYIQIDKPIPQDLEVDMSNRDFVYTEVEDTNNPQRERQKSNKTIILSSIPSLETMMGETKKQYCKKKKIPESAYPYEGYYHIFLIGEPHTTAGGWAQRHSKFAVCFKEHNSSNIAHELLHAMGLPHSYDYTDRQDADYAYKYQSTDNVMDYSHMRGAVTNRLYLWQWKKINDKMRYNKDIK